MAHVMSSELMVSASPQEPGRQLRWGDAFEVKWSRQGGLLNSAVGRPSSAPHRGSAVKVCVFGKRGGSGGSEGGDRRNPILLKQVFEKVDRGRMTVTLPPETGRSKSGNPRQAASSSSSSPSTKGIVSCWVVVACISSSRGTMEAGRSQDFPVLGQGDQFWQVRRPALQQSSSEVGSSHLVVQWMERSRSQDDESKVDAVKISLCGCAGSNLAQVWQGNTGTALLQLPENLPTCLGYKVFVESVELGSSASEHLDSFPLRGESKAFGMPSTRMSPVTCFRCRAKYGDAAAVASVALAEHSNAAFVDDTLSNRDGARAVVAAAADREHSYRRRSSPRSIDGRPDMLVAADRRRSPQSIDAGVRNQVGGKGSPRPSALETSCSQLSCSSSEGPSTPPERPEARRAKKPSQQQKQQQQQQEEEEEEQRNEYPGYRPLREKYKKQGARKGEEGEERRRRRSRSSSAKQRPALSPQPSQRSERSVSTCSDASSGHKVLSVVCEDNDRALQQWARRKDREVSLAKAMSREGGASPSKLLASEPSISRRIAAAVANGNIMNMAAADMDGMLPNAIDHDQPIAVLLPEEGDIRERFAAAIACGNVVDMRGGGDLDSVIPNMIDHNRPAAVLM